MVKRRTPDSESSKEEESDASSSSSEEEAQTAAKSVSEYEKQRLSRIAENKARLEALGLPKMASSLKGKASSSNNKGKKKVLEEDDDDDDDDEYRPNEEEPASDSSSQHDQSDKDEDFVVGNASGSRKRKVKNKGSKIKAKVSGKKHYSSNSEFIDDDEEDEALRQAIALSLQDTPENSTDKHVVNMTKAEKKGNIHTQEDKGRKNNKKSFASRLQMTEDELIVHFFQLDEAGKGTVTIRDIQRAAIAHDFVWTDKELVDMIHCFDSDGDGKLSFDDFRKIVVRCKMIKGS